MSGAVQAIGKTVYIAAREAGATVEEAKRLKDEAKDKARLQMADDDPVRLTVNTLAHRLAGANRENLRLRREREALIQALADALGVDEPTALAIARLDVEEDET